MAQENSDNSGVHLWLILMKANAALLHHAHENIRDLKLCDSDFFVLEVLLHKGALPVNTIGQKVRLTSGSISVAIDRLVTRGLVERSETAGDRRVRMVQLTPTGQTLIESAFRAHAEAMEHATSGITVEEKEQLIRLLRKLGKSAEAKSVSSPVLLKETPIAAASG
jgi:MarR family transcriptional regulator, 2-MHQ and catechol-resistance regulon repressor